MRKRQIKKFFKNFFHSEDKIRFTIIVDESCRAVEIFGVEPQCDFWVEQIYTETVIGECIFDNDPCIKYENKIYDLSPIGINLYIDEMLNGVSNIEQFLIDEEVDNGSSFYKRMYKIENLTTNKSLDLRKVKHKDISKYWIECIPCGYIYNELQESECPICCIIKEEPLINKFEYSSTRDILEEVCF